MIQDGRKGRDRSGRRRPGGDAYGRAKAAGSAGDADGGHLSLPKKVMMFPQTVCLTLGVLTVIEKGRVRLEVANKKVSFCFLFTPWKFNNIAPENKKQKGEDRLPTMIFQGRPLNFGNQKCFNL